MRLTDYLKEEGDIGTVTTGDVAGVRSSLMKPIKRVTGKKCKIKKVFESEKSTFNSADVSSKLEDAEGKSKMKQNSVAYGIEDADGNITKVYVDREQDKEFKQALSELLSDEKSLDVAEILFNLRNKFNILYVDWPKLPEDEEVDNVLDKKEGEPGNADQGELKPGEEGKPGEPGAEGEGKPEEELPAEPPAESPDSQSLLLQVIDMLRADAEAKKAESVAKAKEAEAETAKYSLQLTNVKVKNEEDMLKADDFYKKQADEKKEQDRINKLAQYRNDVVKNTTYESKMTFLDVLNNDINEDVNNDIAHLQAQIADINLRKQKAIKVYDDQLRLLQQRLQQRSKQSEMQAKQQQRQNPQGQQVQQNQQGQPAPQNFQQR
jgi:hypothetical protein